jgi:uncharacterized repeat protein (TIGR01451 family)
MQIRNKMSLKGEEPRIPQGPFSSLPLHLSISAICIVSLILCLLFLCSSCNAVDGKYYSGQEYTFTATEKNALYNYAWSASASHPDSPPIYDKDTFVWIAPMVDTPTNVTIALFILNSADITGEACVSEAIIKVLVEPLGTITVVKYAVPNDPQAFQFKGRPVIGDFTLYDDGSSDPDPTPNSQTFEELLPGTYSIEEIVSPGWDLTSVVCSDGSPVNAIDLSPGETAIVTYTNTKRGSIIVDEVTSPSGDPQKFDFTPNYGPAFNLSDTSDPNNSGLVVPGSYSITQTALAGWDLTDISVTGIASTPVIDKVAGTITFDLAAGETAVVTYTNTKRGSIIVDEVTSPSGDPQKFDFTPNYGPAFNLSDTSDPNNSGLVVPGSYSITQTALAGWNLTDISVTGIASTPVIDRVAGTITFDLAAGETAVVTYTNTKRGSIIVDKVTSPAGDPHEFDFTTNYGKSFKLNDTSDPNDSGPLEPGTYSVAEIPVPCWDTQITCGDDCDPSAIQLSPGETVYVTAKNTKSPPTVTIAVPPVLTCTVKSVTIDATVTPEGTYSYRWKDAGNNVISTSEDPVISEPGTYTLNVTSENGCIVKETVTVTQDISVPTVTIALPAVLNCTVKSVTIDATVTPEGTYSYRWKDAGNNVISTSEDPVISEPGTYTLNVTGTNGCIVTESVTVNYKECEPVVGSISGTKFEDKNGNKEWDTNEPGLGEWIINLIDQNGDVVKTATTSTGPAALGSYSINSISPGTYSLEEVPSLSSDWTQTYPVGNIYMVVISETGQVTVTKSDQTDVLSTQVNFGNKFTQSGELEVTKTTPDVTLIPNMETTFTITVKNIGKIEIHDIKIVDELSPMLEFIPYAYSGDTLIQHTIDGSNLIFDLGPLGSLQPGNSWTITYNVKLSPEACSAASTLTTLPPIVAPDETKLKVMASGSDPGNIVQIIDALSRNKTKLEAKLESIKKHRDTFDKANATLESDTQSIAGTNYTRNNYTNISTGETLNEQLNYTGFLVLSEYTRPVKYDLLTTTYGTKGEVLSDFYTFLPTKETLKIEYNKPEKGYKTYTVRYYATGDTLIITVDSYGNVVSREYRRTPGLAEPEYLTNCATAYGSAGDQDGPVVSNRACVDLGWNCQSPQPVLGLRVFKEADREVAQVGDTIKYKYTVENTGTIVLNFLTLNDDKLGIIVLNDPDPLDPGESRTYYAYYVVKNGDGPILKNTVVATALDPDGNEVTAKAIENVKIIKDRCLCLTKTASPKVVKPGDYVTYNITWYPDPCCPQGDRMIVDDYPSGVSFISAFPAPVDDGNNNKWIIDGQVSGTITILVLVAQNIGNTSFDMGQGVTGTGFVNVHNDIRTNPVILSNKATLFGGPDRKTVIDTAYADVNVGPPQTYVALKEHGSGDYASEDVIKYQNSNRSIEWTKGLTATYKPTTFSLPNNRDINYKTKWVEKARSKNYATGGSTNEEYTYANRISRNSSLKLDENGSTMKTETDFEGVGHIGLVKKDADANRTWNASQIFESQEDYVGSFKINEKFDEYGKNAEYEKSVSGIGYVAGDRNIGNSQKSYESGTGKYQSEERISTVVNYIAKDINLTHLPTSYNYTPTFSTSSDLLWNEGMWSKTPTSLISEQFSFATDLDLQSTSRGLNEMVTKVGFTGQADFRTVYQDNSHNNSTGEVDQEETYVGQFDIQRKTTLGGVAKYDRPHLSLSKVARVDMLNTTFADYRITIENNGNQALGPVYVKDVFPTGTEYITSSLRPAELTTSYANWSLLSMGIGSKVIIDLRLNITEEPSNLVNRVEAAGKYTESWTLARNFSVVRLNWLTCCPPQFSATKTAKVDALDPKVVWYSLSLKNREKYTMVAFLMDQLPLSMQLLNSSLEPSENRSNLITWTFLDLAPGESRKSYTGLEPRRMASMLTWPTSRPSPWTGRTGPRQMLRRASIWAKEEHYLRPYPPTGSHRRASASTAAGRSTARTGLHATPAGLGNRGTQ